MSMNGISRAKGNHSFRVKKFTFARPLLAKNIVVLESIILHIELLQTPRSGNELSTCHQRLLNAAASSVKGLEGLTTSMQATQYTLSGCHLLKKLNKQR